MSAKQAIVPGTLAWRHHPRAGRGLDDKTRQKPGLGQQEVGAGCQWISTCRGALQKLGRGGKQPSASQPRRGRNKAAHTQATRWRPKTQGVCRRPLG